MPLYLVTIKDKSLDEEQVVLWTVLEAESETEAHSKGWDKANALTDEFSKRRKMTRLVVERVNLYVVGEWRRPYQVCNRRHRGPDGKFPE